MKRMLFYCTLILGGIIGTSVIMTVLSDPMISDVVYFFLIAFVFFIIFGLVFGLMELKNIDK